MCPRNSFCLTGKPWALEFGDQIVSTLIEDSFWADLGNAVPEGCIIHLRHCYAGTVAEKLAGWIHRSVTGPMGEVLMDINKDKSWNELPGKPDYYYEDDIVMARYNSQTMVPATVTPEVWWCHQVSVQELRQKYVWIDVPNLNLSGSQTQATTTWRRIGVPAGMELVTYSVANEDIPY